MKNIFVICLMVITGLTQAQTFNFSCTDPNYDASTFGDLIDFMPSTSANALDFDAPNDIIPTEGTLVGGTLWYTVKDGWYISLAKKFNNNTKTHDLGGATIHNGFFSYGQVPNEYLPSSHDKFNANRITGGEYDGYVMIVNGGKIDVIAKWTDTGVVYYAYIFYKTWDWRTNYNNQPHIHLWKLPSATNFNN